MLLMKWVRLAIFIILLSLLVACTPPPEEGASFPIEVTDQLGRLVQLGEVPQRIVSLAPSNTEILFALGLGDKVVGVTGYCDYPPEAQEKPSVGGFSTPNVEEVVALSPDLILATSIHEKSIPQLEDRGMTVFALNPKTLDEVLESITLVGEISGKDEEASILVAEMRNRIEAITDETDNLPESQRPSVFYVTWHDPLKTAGSGTRHDELIIKAGGINMAGELTGYADISLEAVLEANPQVIIAGVGMGSGEDLTLQFANTEPRLENVDARINNRVYGVNDDITGRPGPRIVEALEQLAKMLHPELFE